MIRKLTISSLLITIFLLINSIGYSQNVKITDFDVPVSRAQQLILNGFYNWSQTGDSVTTNEFNVAGNYNRFYTSLPFAWSVGITASTSRKFNDTTRIGYALSSDIRKYFARTTGFFGFAGVTSNYLFQRENDKPNRPEVDLNAGLGYGRFINATSLAKAIRIDQDLRSAGITTKYMPKTTMIEIAKIIDRESEYRTKYKAIYEAKIIEDIAAKVAGSGVSKETALSSLSFFRIRQVLFGINQFINPRYYGGDIRVGVDYTVLTRNASIVRPAAGLIVLGRYSYPIDIKQQVNLNALARTPMDSLFFKQITGQGGVDYSYNLTNKISFVAAYQVTFVQTADISRPKISVANHLVTAGLNFYLENYISLNMRATYEKPYNQLRRMATNIGLTYTFF